MNSSDPNETDSRTSANSSRLLWFIFIAAVLVALIAVLLPRPKAVSSEPLVAPKTSSPELTRSAEVSRMSSVRRRSSSGTGPEQTKSAEEIVAAKLAQFARSRRALADALARQHGMELSDDVKRFFDAAEAGDWDELQSLFKSLAARHNAQPRSQELDVLWGTILETIGTAEQAHLWPAGKLLDYGDSILNALRPGMVYVGGSDPGRFIPTLLNETSEGERHMILTQNGLADKTYLDYLRFLYGDQLALPSDDERRQAFDDYVADFKKRWTHDQEYPNEPKQVRPGENVRATDGSTAPGLWSSTMKFTNGRVEISGDISIMAVNEFILQSILQKNPALAFGLEESFALNSTYPTAAPLGPLMELRASDQNPLTAENAAQSIEYWRELSQQLTFDPETPAGSDSRNAYAHMIEAQGNLFANNHLNEQAEQAYRIAGALWPDNSQILGVLAGLLAREGRGSEANQLLDHFARSYPKQQAAVETIRGNIRLVTAKAAN